MSDQLPFHLRMDAIIGELVPLAAALKDAAVAGNEVLYKARESDCDELLAQLCVYKLRALALFMAAHLAALGWRLPEHPDAAAINPDEQLPANPPEASWEEGR